MKRIMITALVTAMLTGGGAAVAASLITSAQIADHTIRARDMHDGSVNSRVVADGSLRLRDLSPTTRTALKGDPGPPGEPGADATSLWAAVNNDGTLRSGSGVVSVTKTGSSLTGNSRYEVTFNRDVDNCAVTGSSAGGPTNRQWMTVSQGVPYVVVTFTDTAGLDRDAYFSLAVFC